MVCLLVLLIQMPMTTWAAAEPTEPPTSEEPLPETGDGPEDTGTPEEPEAPEEPGDPGEIETPETPEEPEVPEEPAAPPADPADPPVEPGGDDELLPAGEPIDLTEAEIFSAAEVMADAGEGGNVYDQLGLDVAPTDAESAAERERRSELKPYGEQDFDITLNEVFTMGSPAPGSQSSDKTFTTKGAGTLYGQNAREGHTLQNPNPYSDDMQTRIPTSETSTTAYYLSEKDDRSRTVAGDFTGSGKNDKIAVLSSRGPNATYPTIANCIQLSVGDPVTMGLFNIGVLSSKPTDGPWLDFEYAADDLNIATGDLDGNGVDEIVVLVPVYSAGRLRAQLQIYKLTGTDPYRGITTSGNGWYKIHTQDLDIGFGNEKPSSTSGILRNHALAVGDLDGDGLGDIAITSTQLEVYGGSQNINVINKTKSRLRLNVIFPQVSGSSVGFTNQKQYTYIGDSTNDSATNEQTMNNSFDSGTNPLFDGAFGQGGKTALMYLPTREGIDYVGESQTGEPTENTCLMLPTNLGVSIVDVDGALGNELLLGYTLYGNTTSETSSASMGYVGYGADVVKFDKSNSVNELRRMKKGTDPATSTGGFKPQLLVSVLDLKEAISSAKETALKYNGTTVSYFKNVYSSTGSFLKLSTTATKLTAARLNTPDETPYIIIGNNRHKKGGDTYTFDLPKATKGPSMFGYFPLTSAKDKEYDVRFYSLEPGALSTTVDGNPAMAYGYLITYYRAKWSGDDDAVYTEFITGNSTAQPTVGNTAASGRLLASKSNVLGIGGGTLVDTDNDSVRLSYLEHDLGFSAPTVVAALASQPYYADIARLEGGSYSSIGAGTTYSYSVGVGDGKTESSAHSLGSYVSAEVEVGCPFVSAHMEFEVNTGHTWTEEVTSNTTYSYEDSFTCVDENSVVLIAYPIDVYRYTMTYPTDVTGQNKATCDYTVNVPQAPSFVMVTVDKYNSVYRQYPDILPDIDKEVFTHEVGYPGTYPTSGSGYRDAHISGGSGGLWHTSPSSPGLSTAYTFTISKETQTVSSVSNSVDMKIGAGASFGAGIGVSGKVTAGVTFGSESSAGKIKTETTELSYSAAVDGIPRYAATGDYSYQWKMMQYMYYGKQNFPVVTYLVNNDNNKVNLPVDYGVDESGTTSSQITLYWEPSRDDTNPGVSSNMEYGVFSVEFLGGTEQEPKPVQENYGTLTFDADAGYYYYTISKGLLAGEVYNFRLACKPKARNFDWSVYSTLIVAATNPSGTTPAFTTQPSDLSLRPNDGVRKISATFGGATVQKYTWQRYNEKTYQWDSVSSSSGVFSGISTSELSINVPSITLEGSYRLCAEITLKGTTKKQFYSEPAQVSYSPFVAEVTLDDNNPMIITAESFIAGSEEQAQALQEAIQEVTLQAEADPNTLPEFELDVQSVVQGNSITFTASAAAVAGQSGSAPVPTGELQFQLTLPTGSMDIRRVSMDASGKASSGVFELPRDGAYELVVIYPGDNAYARVSSKVFRFFRFLSSTSTEKWMYLGDEVPTEIEYGDKVEIPAMIASASGEVNAFSPRILVEKLENGVYTSMPSNWQYYEVIQFKAAGTFRITLSSDATVNKIFLNINVKPRPVTLRINNIVRYLPQHKDTMSMDDLEIVLHSGTILPGDTLPYNNDNLRVYRLGTNSNSTAEPITIDSNTPAGTYAIRLDRNFIPPPTPNYIVTVREGTYTIRESDNTSLVTFGVQGTGGRVAAVLPESFASGYRIEHKTPVILQAFPDPGYTVDSWRILRDGNEDLAVETGARKEVLELYDIEEDEVDVQVRFIAHEDTIATNLIIHPGTVSGIPYVVRGGTLQFYAEVEGSALGVTWKVGLQRATKKDGTTIDSNGLLTVDPDELKPGSPVPGYPSQEVGFLYVDATTISAPHITKRVLVWPADPDEISPESVFLEHLMINAPPQVVVPGGSYLFEVLKAIDGDDIYGHAWELVGAQDPATFIGADDVLYVGPNEPSGTMLTLKVQSNKWTQRKDEARVLVSTESINDTTEAGSLSILRSHVSLTAGNAEAVAVPLFIASGVLLDEPKVYPAFSGRTAGEEVSGKLVAEVKNGQLLLRAGSAAVDESFVVRLVSKDRPSIWAECVVDIAAGLPAEPVPANLQKRNIGAATVTAHAYSTADVVIPLYRVNNTTEGAADPWSLRESRVQVTLPENSTLLGMFERELTVLDENHVVLVPKSTADHNALAGSRTTTFKNQTLELRIDDKPTGLITGKFTLKINKKLPTIKASPIVLDTWDGPASATPVFTGGTVTALNGTLPAKATWLTYKSSGLSFTAIEGAKGSATVTMMADVTGWTAPVKVSFKVTAKNAYPSLKLKSGTAKLYKDHTLSIGTTLTLMPKSSKDTLAAFNVASVQVDPDYADQYSVADYNSDDGTFTLKALADPKNEKIRLQVRFGGKSRGVMPLEVRVSVVKTALKLKLAKTTITLNNNLQEITYIPIGFNVPDVDIANFYLRGERNDNEPSWTPAPELMFMCPNSHTTYYSGIETPCLRIEHGSKAIAGRTYKFDLQLWNDWSDYWGGGSGKKPITTTTISVKVIDSPAKVSLTAKGKMDISKADPAPITLTAKFSNYFGNLGRYDILGYPEGDPAPEDVEFAIYRKVGKEYVPVYDETGTLTLDPQYAVSGAFTINRTGPMTWSLLPSGDVHLEPGSYKIGIVNGPIEHPYEKSIVTATDSANPSRYYTAFTVTASKPKATVSGPATLYRGYRDSEHTVTVSLPAGSQAIDSITLSGAENANMYFDTKDLGGGKVAIHFHQTHTATKKGVSIKAIDAAKTKTLTLNVFLKGGSTVRPATTVKVKVNVL